MSLEWLQWAWEQKVQSPSERLVLLALGNVANPINPADSKVVALVPPLLEPHIASLGYAYPGLGYIAAKSLLSERQVRRVIDSLQERDLFVTVARRRDDGYRGTDGYLLITSPDILSGKNLTGHPGQFSPDICDSAYIEDTQGLIHKSELRTPLAPELSKPPLPPVPVLRWTSDLTADDWRIVQAAATSRDGVPLSTKFLADQFEEWLRDRRIVPNNVLKLFLRFISIHKERNKL